MPFEHPTVPNAYDRSSDRPNDTGLVFAEDTHLQGAELNELQAILKANSTRAAQLSASDGDRRTGAGISVNTAAGSVTLEAGTIFAAGDVRPVAAAVLTGVPMDGEIQIGVRLVTAYISPEDDATLKGLHPGTEAEGEDGAWRVAETVSWGWSGDGQDGDLYAVYRLQNGTVLDTTPPAQLSATQRLIALDGRTANGSYIAEGCKVTALSFDSAGSLVLDVAAGVANIFGYRIERNVALRHTEAQSWQTQQIDGESHTFVDAGDGQCLVTLRQSPLDSVVQTLVEKEVTETITRASAANGMDQLGETSIVSVVSVAQGETAFEENVDYTLTGDHINWILGGAEPDGGSSYDVVYRYRDAVTPVATTSDTVTVTGGRENGEIIITYKSKLPQIDLVCLTQAGEVAYIKGLAAVIPTAPVVPSTLLKLAEVHNDFDDMPTIVNNGTFNRTFDEIDQMYQLLMQTVNLVALNRLQLDISVREPTAKYGTFVDPFIDDQWRDAGENQDAACFDGVMTLAVDAAVLDMHLSGVQMLPYELETVIDQPLFTTCKLINRFANATPLPAEMTLTPAEDFFTETREAWLSTQTRTVANAALRGTTRTATVIQDERTAAAEFVRSLTVQIDIAGFGAGENLAELTFDGVDINPGGIAADDAGQISYAYEIPAQSFTVGRKQITAMGEGGSQAQSVFLSQGEITFQTLQQVVTTFNDPRGQIWSWPLGSAGHCAGAQVTFCKVGDPTVPCIAELRAVASTGYPTSEVIDQHVIDMSAVVIGSPYQIAFETLPFISDLEQTALVILTPDFEHSIETAELGEFDARAQQFVTRQPYPVGQEIESSTGSTWSPVDSSDLTFSIQRAAFTATSRTITVGSVTLAQASNLVLKAVTDYPVAETSVKFELARPGHETIELIPDTPVELDEWYSGTATLTATLIGSGTASPRLASHVQLIVGTVRDAGTYVSRSFDVNGGTRLPVRIKQIIPSGSSVTVSVQTVAGWHELPFKSGEVLEINGWVDALYEDDDLPALGLQTAVKIEFGGSPVARPIFTDLRAVII